MKYYILVGMILLCWVFLGFQAITVLSSSMQPTISAGDMMVVLSAGSYSVGDIVTYRQINGQLVTHRVTEVTTTGYWLKGDANDSPDPKAVLKNAIVGKVLLVVPMLGFVFSFFSQMWVLGLIGLIIIYLFIKR